MWKRIKQYFKEYFEYRRNRRLVLAEMAKLGTTALPVINNAVDETERVVGAIDKVANVILNSTPESLISDVVSSAANALDTSQPQLMNTMRYIASLSTDEVQSLVVNATLALNMQKIDEIRAEETSDVNDIQELE